MPASDYWSLLQSSYPVTHEVCGGRWVAIRPTLFQHCALIRGSMRDPVGHRDEWLYPDEFEAELALHKWELKGFEGEPEGYVRHKSATAMEVAGSA
jgi:hypothetical protein